MAKRTPVAATPAMENPAKTSRRPVDLTDKAVAALRWLRPATPETVSFLPAPNRWCF